MAECLYCTSEAVSYGRCERCWALECRIFESPSIALRMISQVAACPTCGATPGAPCSPKCDAPHTRRLQLSIGWIVKAALASYVKNQEDVDQGDRNAEPGGMN